MDRHVQNGKSGSEPKIALVIVWFGPWPFWMPAFLLSCLYNPQVAWIIYSDSPPPPNCPKNVLFIRMDMAELNHRASLALGMDILLRSDYAYKICDLRPAYGAIFQNDLHPYEYWGHCDLDVIWGDIMYYLGPEVLGHYDIITSRIRRISGHFCIFRNVPHINTLYKSIPRIQTLIKDSVHHAVDETHLTHYLQSQMNPGWIGRIRRALYNKQPTRPTVFWDKVLTTSGSYQRRYLSNPTRCMVWRQGRVFGIDEEEIMYIHFHMLRKQMKTINFCYQDHPNTIEIRADGIYGV